MAANDDVFDPNEPTEAAVHAYATTLSEMVVDNAEVNAAVTKKLKAKLAFFGDGSRWSRDKVEQFDGMLTLALLAVAKSHLRHDFRAEDVSPGQLIDHACAAIDAVVRCTKQEALGK